MGECPVGRGEGSEGIRLCDDEVTGGITGTLNEVEGFFCSKDHTGCSQIVGTHTRGADDCCAKEGVLYRIAGSRINGVTATNGTIVIEIAVVTAGSHADV